MPWKMERFLNILIESASLSLASVHDCKTLEVPLWLFPLTIILESVLLLLSPGSHWDAFSCAAAAFVIMLIPAVFGRGGGADALAACSLCLALDGIFGLYALMIGEFLTIPYQLYKKGKREYGMYPLIPFLTAGFFMALFSLFFNG